MLQEDSLYNIPIRPRRNRRSKVLRNLVSENHVKVEDFIFPLFLVEGTNKTIEVPSMPNIFRYSLDKVYATVEEAIRLGIGTFVLFPSLSDEKKDKVGTEALNKEGLYLTALNELRKRFGEDICLMTDVALDPYSSDGHDGYVENGKIINDITLGLLAKMAVAQAQAGADLIGPSDMMDGRVGTIRQALDKAGFSEVGILSYTAKYASAFYGPFRDALDSAPKFGDKKTYQMNPANSAEAKREVFLDEAEGADILMVKPALSYLDVIKDVKQWANVPVAAYNVSGEYAMVKAAAQKGWVDGDKVMAEILLSIKRAGADIILTYFALEFAKKYGRIHF